MPVHNIAEPIRRNSHMEQVLCDMHCRASIFYLRHTSSTVRKFLELFWMLLAVSGFGALICLHLAFVYRGNPTPISFRNTCHHPIRSIPSTCLPNVPGFRPDADVTHLVLLDDDMPQSVAWELGSPPVVNESMLCNATHVCKASVLLSGRVHFSFSRKSKGYASLTPGVSVHQGAMQGVDTQIVAISKTDACCFGEPFLQKTVFLLLGPDLVMMNWLLAVSNGTGYIYNPRTDQTVDLSKFTLVNIRKPGIKFTGNTFFNWRSWFGPWTSKFKTAVKTCTIYFITTNLVSFLLRVAQERLLDLLLQILSHQQENRPIIPLFVTHVADCFVFVPITVGVLYYLREFYQGDWVIATAVMGVVFVCEIFSFVSCRTVQGIFFFPRAFFLLFCLVHFYLFSFPFGFSYVAMWVIFCFMLQCCTFFWNRYEVPAVARGRVALDHRSWVDQRGAATVRESYEPQPASNSNAGHAVRHALAGFTDCLTCASLPLQAQQLPVHSHGHGASCQGLMSRADSEVIFQRADAEDEESESCLYLLGGEVVIRRGESAVEREQHHQLQSQRNTNVLESNRPLR